MTKESLAGVYEATTASYDMAQCVEHMASTSKQLAVDSATAVFELHGKCMQVQAAVDSTRAETSVVLQHVATNTKE